MVTAILPPLTDDSPSPDTEVASAVSKPAHNPRHSVAMSLESDMTITPERYRSETSDDGEALLDQAAGDGGVEKSASEKPSALAGYVGLFTGCGALVALSLFLQLPARFGDMDGVTPAEAITDSFYVVGTVSLAVGVFVFIGLRGLKGEHGKGWRLLLGLKNRDAESSGQSQSGRFPAASDKQVSSTAAQEKERGASPRHCFLKVASHTDLNSQTCCRICVSYGKPSHWASPTPISPSATLAAS